LVNRRKDGSLYHEEMTITPVKNKSGDITHFIAIKLEITERKRLEGQLAASQKMEAVGQLAGGIAHDFNNLLGVIMGYTEMLLGGFSSDDPRFHKLEQIGNAAHRAAALTRQLLAYGRKQALQPRVLDLNVLIAEFSKLLRRMVREDIELVTILKPGTGNIKADSGQVEQVIMNLVVNARDAMPNGGKIIIETRDAYLDESYCRFHPSVKPGRYVMVAVSDTGMGMDATTQLHIFEPFFTTKEQGKGTGLGLATVYGIVKQSKGNIWAYSQLGKGTTFKTYFPRVEEAVEAVKISRERVEPLRGSETILLVEDSEALRELAQALLEQNGYKVLVAEGSKEAIELTERLDEEIHLLLTDVVMPGINGRELANRLKTKHADMKVLYTSGYTRDVIVHNGVLELGMSFIEKPFSEEALMHELREVLDLK